MKTIAELYKARFGIERDIGRDMKAEGAVAGILNRRSIRRYTDEPVSDDLLDVLLACAQSAPAKSDLQQYSIIVVTDPKSREVIGDWEGKAPVFLMFCADNRRIRRLAEIRGHDYQNDNIDTFMNGCIDAALAMQCFINAAESVGLGCCPISGVRNRIELMCELLALPDGVFPICGLTVGWPAVPGFISMRLPPASVVHRDKYDDSSLEAETDAYDRRRHAIYAIPPEKQRHTDKYGALDFCGWSENATRQLSLPERAGFKAFLNSHGFRLD
ncbi:MAG: nitroreductase family protein [Alphaproteobacteria bacterium]